MVFLCIFVVSNCFSALLVELDLNTSINLCPGVEANVATFGSLASTTLSKEELKVCALAATK